MALSRRLRLILLAVGALALTATLVAVAAVYLLLQPDRFTAMLQSQARDTGLELILAHPASPTLFPRPALDLQGITLNARGANAPILLAARGRLALPWRTLFGGPTVITQLQIDAPRVDLDALQSWLKGLPVAPPGAPREIPRIKTGIRISNGSMVRGNQLLLGNVTLEAGSLISGQPTFLLLSATTSRGTPLQMQLSATPSLQGNTLRLDDVVLHLSQGDDTVLDLRGTARWHGEADAAATLAGTLDHAHAGKYAVSLTLTPADQVNPLLLALKLDGTDNHADLRLPPLMLARWWSQLGNAQGPRLNMPPGSGHAEFSKIEVGGVSIEGLTLQAGDNVPAAAGTSAPAKPAAGKP